MHVIGKGITRFHAVYWPAFLLSANLSLPKSIFVHGYFTVNGQKMSKTLGNVVDPINLIDKFTGDGLRYYLLAKFSPFTDGDFSEEKLTTVYNADLANGLGNLVSRIAKLCELSGNSYHTDDNYKFLDKEVTENLNIFRFDLALNRIWALIDELNKQLTENKPWEKDEKTRYQILKELVAAIRHIGYNLGPFLPEVSQKIEEVFSKAKIKSTKALFPRI